MKAIMIALGVLLAGAARVSAPHGLAEDPRVTAVSGYAHWSQATKRPVQMTPRLWLLCVAPTPEEQRAMDEFNRKNPHSNGYIRVYANEFARLPLLTGGDFPAGSILVKEKMIGPDSGLVARTVMRKHDRGWNPSTGDWEFYVLSKDMRLQSSASSECVSCHGERSNEHWVFRSYVGPAASVGAEAFRSQPKR